MIELKNVTKIYKSKKGVNTTALNDVSVKIEDKGMIFVVGKSGSGKSTFLNVISGLDKYDTGEIIVNGKSFKDFKNSDYDSYRNTYIGFVFQEFNLLDEYDVEQNVALSMHLQKKKISKEKVADILTKVGLVDVEKRKINELSGGQKQRVSIARALIKSPKIILADEPTGSLDSNTSKQIFELLKEISKERLVIVVSHDVESAKIYADRIIQFSDGKITYDSGITPNVAEDKDTMYVKSKLPLLSSLKLSLANLKRRKIRLIFTILLTTFAITFLGVSKMLTNYNLPYSHAQTMAEEKNSLVYINKNMPNEEGGYSAAHERYLPFTEDEIKELETKLSKKMIKVNALYEQGQSIEFNLVRNFDYHTTPAYYFHIFSDFYFVEANDEKELNLDIIGKYPTAFDEVLIHKALADYIMYNGIYLYLDKSTVENELKNPELYKPTSYEQILTEGKYVGLGSNKVKIVGIVDDDLSKYQLLKNVSYGDMTKADERLLRDLTVNYGETANKIYVKEGFAENFALEPNFTVGTGYSFEFINLESMNYELITSSAVALNKDIEVTDGEKDFVISQLNDNEIIVNKEYLIAISNRKFEEQLAEYISANISSSSLTEEELTNNYINRYLSANNVIGSTVDLKIGDYTQIFNTEVSTTIENIKIVGYTNDESIYMSHNIIEKYLRPKYEVLKLYFFEENQEQLENIFIELPIDNAKFTTETSYSYEIIAIIDILESVAELANYASIVFFIFAVILLINFISATIVSSKKQIGILRAIGARKKDILNIFLAEGILIGILSLSFAIVLCLVFGNLGNTYLVEEFTFSIKPIIFTFNIVLYLLISVSIVIIVSSIIPSYKISSMNPIDAIYEK